MARQCLWGEVLLGIHTQPLNQTDTMKRVIEHVWNSLENAGMQWNFIEPKSSDEKCALCQHPIAKSTQPLLMTKPVEHTFCSRQCAYVIALDLMPVDRVMAASVRKKQPLKA
jgi:hypothetical protein